MEFGDYGALLTSRQMKSENISVFYFPNNIAVFVTSDYAEAQNRVAFMYEGGRGVELSSSIAVEWPVALLNEPPATGEGQNIATILRTPPRPPSSMLELALPQASPAKVFCFVFEFSVGEPSATSSTLNLGLRGGLPKKKC